MLSLSLEPRPWSPQRKLTTPVRRALSLSPISSGSALSIKRMITEPRTGGTSELELLRKPCFVRMQCSRSSVTWVAKGRGSVLDSVWGSHLDRDNTAVEQSWNAGATGTCPNSLIGSPSVVFFSGGWLEPNRVSCRAEKKREIKGINRKLKER